MLWLAGKPLARCLRESRRRVDAIIANFLALWRSQATDDAFPALFEGTDRLYEDTIGFAAAKMIRRILGLAHNIDFEWMEDPARRARGEFRVLRLARDLMVNAGGYRGVGAVAEAARIMHDLDPGF